MSSTLVLEYSLFNREISSAQGVGSGEKTQEAIKASPALEKGGCYQNLQRIILHDDLATNLHEDPRIVAIIWLACMSSGLESPDYLSGFKYDERMDSR